ncbi:MAG: CFI-box-CTERM domain-containing protein [Bdellovibrionales bacterium]
MRGMFPFLLLFPLLGIHSAWAAGPSITSVSGASASTLTGTPTILGGAAGTACTGASTSETCNNCTIAQMTCATAASGLCPCNTARIYAGLILRLELKPPEDVTGNAVAMNSATSAAVTRATFTNNGSFIDFYWSDLCPLMKTPTGTAVASCEDPAAQSGTLTLHIYIDKDNDGTGTTADGEYTAVNLKLLKPSDDWAVYGAPTTEGIGNFEPYPGDEKVYIRTVDSTTGFNSLTYGSKAKFARFFISDQNLTQAHAESGLAPEDLEIVDGGDELTNNIISGLENGTTYTLRVGLVDEANNVVQYFPAAGAYPDCESTPVNDANCPFAVTPDEVQGLLTDDMNCFVATATYGSALEPKINVFREFRNQILIPSRWGRACVKAYYHYGPYAARFIRDRPVIRLLVQALLWPFYGFSWLALQIGFAYATALALSLLSALVFLPLMGVGRISRRE